MEAAFFCRFLFFFRASWGFRGRKKIKSSKLKVQNWGKVAVLGGENAVLWGIVDIS